MSMQWETFGVPRDRRIFYIDDDGDSVPIDSECELHEALKVHAMCICIHTHAPARAHACIYMKYLHVFVSPFETIKYKARSDSNIFRYSRKIARVIRRA